LHPRAVPTRGRNATLGKLTEYTYAAWTDQATNDDQRDS
jgi:hypothetical protein